MFRALRFSARLGFTIEEKTLSAIEKKAPLAASLAPERVRDEVEKILLTQLARDGVYAHRAGSARRVPEKAHARALAAAPVGLDTAQGDAALGGSVLRAGEVRLHRFRRGISRRAAARQPDDALLLKRRSACKTAEARRQGSVEARTMRLRGGQRELRRTVLRCFQRRRKRAGSCAQS